MSNSLNDIRFDIPRAIDLEWVSENDVIASSSNPDAAAFQGTDSVALKKLPKSEENEFAPLISHYRLFQGEGGDMAGEVALSKLDFPGLYGVLNNNNRLQAFALSPHLGGRILGESLSLSISLGGVGSFSDLEVSLIKKRLSEVWGKPLQAITLASHIFAYDEIEWGKIVVYKCFKSIKNNQERLTFFEKALTQYVEEKPTPKQKSVPLILQEAHDIPYSHVQSLKVNDCISLGAFKNAPYLETPNTKIAVKMTEKNQKFYIFRKEEKNDAVC